ncbi:MAG: Asp-tRNA(Asn)/Glu-tRNA(Gln) amidotransferase subunit GatA [Actinomycetota bacterium]|nr:Asp-tRNA(Asn)/Glu-tRNA(Gln) amidotransferase subunit GatA [Actinomycetota bacterium]MDA3013687.1 Asp-tRNA(Asn)/Glu-tRNA(Gln) amidotransferase subunit GatA [Actinomycetota bacterium]
MRIENKSIREINSLFQKKEIKPSELYKQVFENTAQSESVLHAHLKLFEEDNLNKVKLSDERYIKNKSLGLLDGIPIAIKDNINLKGYETTCSSKMLSNYISPYSATVINKLDEQQVLYTGKTNLDEFAMGSSTENSAYGLTRNPWNTECVPGGSSGGSAASVAARSSIAALGSDTGGSIRQPASFCGLVGFKPTYGTVSRFGLIAFASSLDQIGPITKYVDDTRIIYHSIRGFDPKDATSVSDKPVIIPSNKTAKVGVIKELMEEGVSEDAKNEVEKIIKLLKAQGIEVIEVSLPLIKLAISIYYLIAPAECSANLARFDGVRYGLRADGKTSYEMMERTRAQGFGSEVKRRILLGTYALSAGYFDAYYGKALLARKKMIDEFNQIFKQVDYLISPTTPTQAFKAGEKTSNPLEMYMSDLCTIPANLAGLPSISIPTGLSKEKLPLGVQIISKALTDDSLLDFSEMIEKEVAFKEEPSDWIK